jgi:hypothetical protein
MVNRFRFTKQVESSMISPYRDATTRIDHFDVRCSRGAVAGDLGVKV